MAHFLGASGATTFLKAVASAGATPGADLLPDAAAANRSVFYDPSGRAAQRGADLPVLRDPDKPAGGAARRHRREPDHRPRRRLGTSPPLIRGLPFDGGQLSMPMAAMLNLFALSALKLLGPTTPAPGSSSLLSL